MECHHHCLAMPTGLGGGKNAWLREKENYLLDTDLLYSSPNGRTETQQELTCLRSLGQGGDRLERVHTHISAAEAPRLLLL